MDDYLIFALAKGRLADIAADRFASAGFGRAELFGNSRKLIFTDENTRCRFFLAKAGDVPTYVETGAADVGVAGKDVLLEAGASVAELLDLGFGKCRVVVAGKPEAAALVREGNDIRVATKYPNIARAYFNDKLGKTVEIYKLSGSVELGAAVGLSDVIVDIVETGSTLRENGLVVVDTIAWSSARLIANRVSMKLKSARIAGLVGALGVAGA
ncbi:MAG: ATP phosphoribosyltransferase [Clostridiales bacterium]|jgi:ATP phosphoribosyltransferase|nr:ATP phosphoribosyltransferase [Clostridiales bacterium]